MPIAFYYPTKAAPSLTWTPASVDPVFPDVQPVDYPGQIVTRTADDTIYVQDKGTQRETFDLVFELMNQADRDSYLAFFNTVKKSFNTFEYEDGDLVLHTVRIMNLFNFERRLPGRFYGSIQLEKV